jgi:hypothetical protein
MILITKDEQEARDSLLNYASAIAENTGMNRATVLSYIMTPR